MMDYRATDSTLCESGPACEESMMSTSEILKEIRKELAETISVLSGIRLSLDGINGPDKKTDEPKCLHDEVLMLEHMAVDCMGLSHAILAKLFGNSQLR